MGKNEFSYKIGRKDYLERSPTHIQCLALIPPLSFVVVLSLLPLIHFQWLVESPGLLLALNTIFLTITPLLASYFTARTYLKSGSLAILAIGSSLIIMAFSSFLAGQAMHVEDDPNCPVTVYNMGFLFSSLFNLWAALMSTSTGARVSKPESSRRLQVLALYGFSIVIIETVYFLTLKDLFPPFFIRGYGPTPFRQVVLSLAVTTYLASAATFMLMYYRKRISFLYWYALSLLLISQGLGIIIFISELGSLTNWAGRAYQYLGGTYFLIAVIGAYKAARKRGVSIEQALPALVGIEDLRRAEEALRTQAQIIDQIHDAVVSTNLGGLVTTWNKGAEKLFGYTAEEAIGRNISFIYPEDQLNYLQNQVIKPLKDKGFHELEVNLRKKSSEIFIAHLSLSLQKDAQGNAYGMIGYALDITERKRAEQALRIREERLRAILESSRDGIHQLDLETGKYVWMSPSQEKLTGFNLDELNVTLSQAGERLHPEDRPVVNAFFEQVSNGQVPEESIVYRWRAKSGEYRWFDDKRSPIYDEQGNIIALVGVSRDITERKNAEEALRERELQFRLLSETAGRLLASEDPQVLIDELCRKVMAHLDCQVFFNFLADEQAGKLHLNAYAGIPDEEALKIEWLDFGVAVCGYVAQEGTRIVAENILSTPDFRTDLIKSYGIQAYACHPLLVQGKVIGTLSFGTRTRTQLSPEHLELMKTVTDQVATAMERKRLLGDLKRSRDDLELRVRERTAELMWRNRELQDFATVASHDLQEPLRKIQVFGEMLQRSLPEDLSASSRGYLDRMQETADRMRQLIKALLAYSRVSTKARPFERVELREIAQRVVQEGVHTVYGHGEALVEIGDLPAIDADPVQISQLFQNLIANAIHYSSAGSVPEVKVSARTVIPESGKRNGRVELRVKDNGIGFDMKYLDKIFTPFERLHTRREREGTGMGLAICRKIVERHGGTITAESKTGEGAAFIVTLPMRQTSETITE